MPPLIDTADHNVVHINVSTKAHINKLPPRIVYLHNRYRVDWPAKKEAAVTLSETIVLKTRLKPMPQVK